MSQRYEHFVNTEEGMPKAKYITRESSFRKVNGNKANKISVCKWECIHDLCAHSSQLIVQICRK